MRALGLAGVMFLIVLAAFLPCSRYQFVTMDDHAYVYRNSHVVDGLSCDNAIWASKAYGDIFQWHPLTWISLQIDASVCNLVFGKEAYSASESLDGSRLWRLSRAMHLHNAVLHAANAALLSLLIVLMAGAGHRDELLFAGAAALLWAIHPLRAEAVCWVSERKEVLSAFWMLLTMIAWVNGSRGWRIFIPLVFFAFALLAKPVAVTLPVALFAWDWVVRRRRFGESILAMIPFILLSAGMCVMTLVAQTGAYDIGRQYTLLEKIAMSFSAPIIYLRQTVLPVGLSAFYPVKPPIPWIETSLGVVLVIGMFAICLLWFMRRLRRNESSLLDLPVFGIAWAYVALLPMLGIVKVGDQTHSDRYTYWAGCALVVVLAVFALRFLRGRERNAANVLAVLVAILTVATWNRLPVWRDSISLYLDSVPKSWAEQPVCALSQLLRQQGEDGYCRAEAMLREALTINKYRGVRAEFAHLLAFKSNRSALRIDDGPDPAFAEARYEAESVLSAEPGNSLANEALAIVEMKEAKWGDALKRLEIARETSEAVERLDAEIAFCREQLKNAGASGDRRGLRE